jgi:hypothetical protein
LPSKKKREREMAGRKTEESGRGGDVGSGERKGRKGICSVYQLGKLEISQVWQANAT